jgi:hypothetical protein
MDRDERELFAETLRGVVEKHTGPALDAELERLGWREALADDPEAAVSILFTLQGAHAATSSALAWVLGGDAAVAPRGVGLDPDLGIVEVAGDLPDDALAGGRLALAHELAGASRRMLELARDHAVERIQFGVPIASFQAVRHRLAEALVAVEAADGVAAATWADVTPVTAALAKATAGRSAKVVRRHSQQVLAGIGFTTEHDLHRYVGRTIALDHLLGDSRTLTNQLGEELLATQSLPDLLPL